MYFAVNLAEYRCDERRDPMAKLHNQLMLLAVNSVNWRRVVESLLRHFGPRQPWLPKGMQASVN